LQFSLPVKPSVKSILLFFAMLIIQVITLAAILILAFQIPFRDVIDQQNIPEPAKYLYLGFLNIFMLFNLYHLDPLNFTAALKLSLPKVKNFGKGFLIAFSALLSLYTIETAAGFLEISSMRLNIALLPIFFFSLVIALTEELLFRNFIFRKLKEDYSLKTALIVSGYIYAQLHFVKFNITFMEIILPLTGLFFIGVILAYVFYFRDLWFSIGMHTAWIILITFTTQQAVFKINPGYYLLTGGYYPIGGAFGILMSIILLIGLRKYLGEKMN
jgi:membrane protease YdiL (CAAX protease family)